MPTTIQIPSTNSASSTTLVIDVSLVLIGSNGSGKSRLGARIESDQAKRVHRISAHKILTLPDDVTLLPEDHARKVLAVGDANVKPQHIALEQNMLSWRQSSRWHGALGIGKPLNDFSAVLSLLFAQKRRRDEAYVRTIRDLAEGSTDRPPLPEAPTDTLLKIWKDLLPNIRISLDGDKVTAQNFGIDYSASGMSDGERVIFYLCAQVLVAEKDKILVIDEPEIHVHKALLESLWDLLEDARPDCTFIYLTQDLEFASSRQRSRALWIKSYSGSTWDWEEVSASEDLPRQLMLEILGTKKPIRFVEGTAGSLDTALYTILFPNMRIKPVNGCDEVSTLVRAANSESLLSTKNISGIVDRDFRSSEKIAYLRSKNIAVLEVAEIENLYCVPEILNFLCLQEYATESEASAAENTALTKIKSAFDEALVDQAAKHAQQQIRDALARFSTTQRLTDASSIKSEVLAFTASIDIDAICQTSLDLYNNAANSGNPKEMLKLLNRKGLYKQIASSIGLSNELYISKVQSCLRKNESLRTAVASYIV